MNLAALSDRTGYQFLERRHWNLLVDTNLWNDSWWPRLQGHMTAGDPRAHCSRHAWSFPVELPLDQRAPVSAYLKLYRDPQRPKPLKDRLRPAKALRAFLVGRDLARDGFRCPRVLALGENRSDDGEASALFLTEALPWPNLRQFALGLAELPENERRRRKRTVVAALGRTVGLLHEHGYVHGDLVTTNILVDPADPGALASIDHDRTVRAGSLWRGQRQLRNLIQLNRHEFPAVTHADRLRFFEAYARERGWSRAQSERTARELAQRTVRRRRELASKEALISQREE
jgi:hypothetical protein